MPAYQLHRHPLTSMSQSTVDPHSPPLGTCQFQARAALFLTHGAGRAPSKENRPGQPKNSVCESLCAWLWSGLFGGKGPANQQV